MHIFIFGTLLFCFTEQYKKLKLKGTVIILCTHHNQFLVNGECLLIESLYYIDICNNCNNTFTFYICTEMQTKSNRNFAVCQHHYQFEN